MTDFFLRWLTSDSKNKTKTRARILFQQAFISKHLRSSHLAPFHPVEQWQSYPPVLRDAHTPLLLQYVELQSPALTEAINGLVPFQIIEIKEIL